MNTKEEPYFKYGTPYSSEEQFHKMLSVGELRYCHELGIAWVSSDSKAGFDKVIFIDEDSMVKFVMRYT